MFPMEVPELTFFLSVFAFFAFAFFSPAARLRLSPGAAAPSSSSASSSTSPSSASNLRRCSAWSASHSDGSRAVSYASLNPPPALRCVSLRYWRIASALRGVISWLFSHALMSSASMPELYSTNVTSSLLVANREELDAVDLRGFAGSLSEDVPREIIRVGDLQSATPGRIHEA